MRARKGPPQTSNVRVDEPSPIRSWWLPCSLVLLLYTLPLAGSPPARNPNELSRIDLTLAMVRYGSVSLDRVASDYGGLPEDHSVREGKAYSDKAPGLSFLAVPLTYALQWVLPSDENGLPSYWPLRHVLTWILVALPASLLPLVLLRGYAGLQRSRLVPLGVLFAVTTPMLTYSTLFFGHVPAAVLLTSSFVLLLRPGRPDYVPSNAAALVSGVLFGCGVATEYPVAVAGPVLLIALLIRRSPLRVLASFLAGGLLGLLPALVYHQLAWGSPWETGYTFKAYAKHAQIHAQGLMGVTLPTAERVWGVIFGAQRGLLYYCPLLWLVPVGYVSMAVRNRRDFWPLVLLTGAFLFLTAGFVDWQGGWCAAARHFTPALPLLVYPVAEAVSVMSGRTWSGVLVVVLAGMSICGAVLSIALTPFFPVIFNAPLAQVTLRSLLDGAAMRNLVSALMPVPPTVLVVLFALAVLALVAVSLIRLLPSTRGPVWIPLVLTASVLAQLGLIWSTAPAPTRRQERGRALFVLARLGYTELARSVYTEAQSLPEENRESDAGHSQSGVTF